MGKCKWCGVDAPVNRNGVCVSCQQLIKADIEANQKTLTSLASQASPLLDADAKSRIFRSAVSAYDAMDKYRQKGIQIKKTDIDQLKGDVMKNLGIAPAELDHPTPVNSKFAKNAKPGCLSLIVLVCLVVFFVNLLSGNGDDGTPSEPDDAAVAVAAQMAVSQYLVSPSSAEFASPSNHLVMRFPDTREFLVESYVDSQNGFGAMLRSDYAVILEYSEDWSQYEILTVIINDEVFYSSRLSD